MSVTLCVERLRSFILPHVTGKAGAYGASLVQRWLRCAPLDLFFKHFPLLGSSSHYSICVPLLAWYGGDWFALRILLCLSLTFFLTNGTKDILKLPRPKRGVVSGTWQVCCCKCAAACLEVRNCCAGSSREWLSRRVRVSFDPYGKRCDLGACSVHLSPELLRLF